MERPTSESDIRDGEDGASKASATLTALGVPPPSNDGQYTFGEAVGHILQFPKRSKGRAAVINAMIDGGFLPCGRTWLYDLISRASRTRAPREDRAPPAAVDRESLGAGYVGEYVKWDIRYRIRWKGSGIVLQLIPANFRNFRCITHNYTPTRHGKWHSTYEDPCFLGWNDCSNRSQDEFREYLRTTRPQAIDICSILGNSDIVMKLNRGEQYPQSEHYFHATTIVPVQDPAGCYEEWENFREVAEANNMMDRLVYDWRKAGSGGRIARLYFDPATYPPPRNEDGSCDSAVFGRLRNCIEAAAERGTSPVVCNGGNKSEKRFRCRTFYRKKCRACRTLKRKCDECREIDGQKHPWGKWSCVFGFSVKWDSFGYYIPLLKSILPECNKGCAWHCDTQRLYY
ncbi:hypothetical protein ACHAXT_013354 [Thalassiosira profunda]